MINNGESTVEVTATRVAPEILERQIQVLRDDLFVRQMLDAIPTPLAVLNSNRQIIYANREMVEMLDAEDENDLLGRLPGDIFACFHLVDDGADCGLGALCRSCGALSAILSGEQRTEECRMTRALQDRIQAHELEVTTTPFKNGDEVFTVFSVRDKSAEYRRQMLERIFFHDILNVVGSIKGFAELMPDQAPEETALLGEKIHEAAEQVIGEVEAQRMLSDAENGRLELKEEICASTDILQRIVRLYEKQKMAEGRYLRISETAESHFLITDQSLLLRIVGNMVVNALEAVGPGETVLLDCREKGANLVFTVQNPGVIPAEAKAEIFRRTYSTKGAGRGLGTYSMRLLSGFLLGAVDFVSEESVGTVFRLCLPRPRKS